VDNKLLRLEHLNAQRPDAVEVFVPAKPNIWDSPLIPAILVGAMLLAGFIPIMFSS